MIGSGRAVGEAGVHPGGQASGRAAPITRMAIVVPAYNEVANLGACLASLRIAADRLDTDRLGTDRSAGGHSRGDHSLRTVIIVAADSCTDGTGDIARAFGAQIVTLAARNVGVARAVGCELALADGSDGLWLANTDADSVVPEHWLVRQLWYANRGADVVAGTVAVDDWHEWPAALRVHYELFYDQERRAGRHHVHGCNLGMSANAYRLTGGFRPHSIGEDRALLAEARASGLTIRYPDDIAVRTSARRHARVIGGGFHSFLAAMAESI